MFVNLTHNHLHLDSYHVENDMQPYHPIYQVYHIIPFTKYKMLQVKYIRLSSVVPIVRLK